jgi:hypothetical protein
VPYLYLFAAYVRLAPEAGITGWVAAAAGFLATVIAMTLVFIPPTGAENVAGYEANIIGQSALVLGVGFVTYALSRRRARHAD